MTLPSFLKPPDGINLRLALTIPLSSFALWLGAVVVVSLAQYPGVVCATPMAWLIALRVGIMCSAATTSAKKSLRLAEAALAGAWLGLLQGILFWAIIPFAGPLQAGEKLNAVLLGIAMTVIGMIACAVLSLITALGNDNKRPDRARR